MDGREPPRPRRPARTGRARSLRGLTGAALATAFGVAIALAFALPWYLIGHQIDGRALAATLWFGLAAALSAGLAMFATRLLAQRPWSARFAAALFLLLLGTAGLSTFFMTLEGTLTTHQRYRFTILFKLWIFAVSGVGELYNVLAIAARLLLPLGLPLTVLFAILVARKPR